MSSKVSSISSEQRLISSFSQKISSSISSILWFSLVMFISPYSNLASVTLYLLCRLLQLLHVLSHSLQFFLDSLELILSQLCPLPALFSSASCTPSFLLSSSNFCSLSEAILTVALRFLSSSSIVTSLLRQVFSTTLMVFMTLSAAF